MARVLWCCFSSSLAPHSKSSFYKDQCICSRSTASSKFVSVSRRLMITAMAASSLLRLLRPGPTILSRSSWEFSPGPDEGGAKKSKEKKSHVRHIYANLREDEWMKKCKYPLVFLLLGMQPPVARLRSWTFPAAPGQNLLHLAPSGSKVEKRVPVTMSAGWVTLCKKNKIK